MLSKIYYGLGVGIISIYLLDGVLSSQPRGTPQARPIGVLRMDKGKYVPPTYSGGSSSSNPYSTSGSKSSGSRSSSYPSSGGYSGGK